MYVLLLRLHHTKDFLHSPKNIRKQFLDSCPKKTVRAFCFDSFFPIHRKAAKAFTTSQQLRFSHVFASLSIPYVRYILFLRLSCQFFAPSSRETKILSFVFFKHRIQICWFLLFVMPFYLNCPFFVVLFAYIKGAPFSGLLTVFR